MMMMMTMMMILIIDYNDIHYDDGDDDKAPGGEQKRAGRARPTIIIHSLHNPPTIIELMMIVKELFQWKYASGNDIMWLEGNVFVAFQGKGGDVTVDNDDDIDGDNKRTKVLMTKRSIV